MELTVKAAKLEVKKIGELNKKFNEMSYEKDLLSDKNKRLEENNKAIADEMGELRSLYEKIYAELAYKKNELKETREELKRLTRPKATRRILPSIVKIWLAYLE